MNQTQTDSRLSAIADIQFKPLAAGLPLPVLRPERRDISGRTTLLRRISSEFKEMPGTALTLPQAARLLGVSTEIYGVTVGIFGTGTDAESAAYTNRFGKNTAANQFVGYVQKTF